MSGGAFEYLQDKIECVADEIKRIVQRNESGYSRETIDTMINAVFEMERAAIFMRRIDWLEEGDDGQEAFHKRLTKELHLCHKRHRLWVEGLEWED